MTATVWVIVTEGQRQTPGRRRSAFDRRETTYHPQRGRTDAGERNTHGEQEQQQQQ